MSKSGVQCQSANSDQAIYCQKCGTVLAGTADGRTVVAQPSPSLPPRKPPGALCMPGPYRPSPTGWTPIPTGRAQQREHTVLVNDISGSMKEPYDGRHTKMDASKRADVSLVINKAQIDPNDETGLVTFDDTAQLVSPISPITACRKEIIQAIQSLQAGGGTDINEGLKVARDAFDWSCSDHVVRRIVLMTDGMGGDPDSAQHPDSSRPGTKPSGSSAAASSSSFSSTSFRVSSARLILPPRHSHTLRQPIACRRSRSGRPGISIPAASRSILHTVSFPFIITSRRTRQWQAQLRIES